MAFLKLFGQEQRALMKLDLTKLAMGNTSLNFEVQGPSSRDLSVQRS